MRGDKDKSSLLPNSWRITSSCLKTVSSNADPVASTDRSTGASVAASIVVSPEDVSDQVELCERSLSIDTGYIPQCAEVLEILHQMAKALHFIHERGIAHLNVKPDNIYVKNNTYKLGDFGCATRIDKSLPIEEGDCRYMPKEMLNDQYEDLDKVDIFSLGASTYELVKGSPLPDSGPQFSHIREGRLPLLPGHSMQFQALLKAMMDPDPVQRPSAKEIMENPIFEKGRGLQLSNLKW